jgi:hypothetical protein
MKFKDIPNGYLFYSDMACSFGWYLKKDSKNSIAIDSVEDCAGDTVDFSGWLDYECDLATEDDLERVLKGLEIALEHLKSSIYFKPIDKFLPGHLYKFPNGKKKICVKATTATVKFFSKDGEEEFTKTELKELKITEILDVELTDKLKDIF